ncbi:acyl-CoA dehydrogenase family protein [Haloquadratum walsbyi]|jgi:Acyl-CoA dehydrogenases|uniref:Acyl-CoA dehydrogenase n=1 Tax=Haloquadratum walsbyi J07HQW2 TaxID=1238425 RepID=U1NDC2_9EURY|nr:acyl-CoA dehydrogenase family protein [Haloquadratum walsbyi]ERG94723.1 MAG: acyl-CoA dehydrogenase [Haloquadratum walsbyi J07HQW2]
MFSSGSGDIGLSERQERVRREIRTICNKFDDEYWRERDAEGEYPYEFVETLADDGWLGVLLPEEHGGKGYDTEEAIAMMYEIAVSGAGFSGAQTVHAAIYNSAPLVSHGSEAMKRDLLPRVASGDAWIQCFSLTEPKAGSESTAMTTQAVREGDEYVINGEKLWTSRIDVSDYLILAARTTPRNEVEKHTNGVSLFLVDVPQGIDNGSIKLDEIDKTVSGVVSSFNVEYDNLRIPAGQLIGEEDNGFYQVLDGLNEERLVIAAEAIGLGELAVEKGVAYANDREVFGRAVGQNQAIQHPLAAAYARLQSARQYTFEAATQTDDDDQKAIGARANTAKYLAAEAAFEAADAAVQTHGGRGVAREYDVERYLREARLTKLVPIAQEMALNYLGENVLELPRSY